MRTKNALMAALVAVLVVGSASPALAGHGSWMAYSGGLEPSTVWDASTHMFQEPNQANVEKLYFNGMIMSEAGIFPYDLDVEGGDVLSPAVVRFAAALGFWRDCNRDGYIGMRAVPASYGSFSVYPRALAEGTIDESICPPDSPYNPMNTETGQPNGYIDEFRWVGPNASYDPSTPPAQTCVPPSGNPVKICPPVDTSVTRDRYDVSDAGARVWVDWAYPGSRHIPQQGITVEPRTTYDSDSTLAYVDGALQGQLSGTLGGVWSTKPNVGACGDEPAFLGGPDGSCGLWALHQGYRLVNDSRTREGDGAYSTPLVQVFDTTQDDSGDGNPCNDAGAAGLQFADPDPDVHPNFLVQGSLGGTASNVLVATNTLRFDGKCATSGLPVGAADDESENELTHRLPSDEIEFVADQRLHLLDEFGFQEMPQDAAGARGTPQALLGTPAWKGRTSFTMRPPRSGWGVLNLTHATYYADVTSDAFASNPLANPVTAFPATRQNAYVYGAEFCPAFTTGPSNVDPGTAWECSTTEWEKKRTDDQRPDRAILGDAYDLRDVDCYDNTVSAMTGSVRLGVADCSATHGS